MRTHVDTSAKAGMLRGANDARRRPAYPHPSFCLTGRNERESRRRERQRHTPGRRQGESACQGEGRVEEREKSDEATNKTRGSQQPSKGRAQERGHGRHRAHGEHHTAPERGASEGQEKSSATHHDTHRTDTTHPHTPTPAPTAPGQRAPSSPPRGRAAGRGGAPDPGRPSQRPTARPRERPTANPTARNAGPQGRAPWGRCWVPTPAPTAPGTHGSQNAGCPPQRTGGWGRTPDAPHNSGRPSPPGTALNHPHGTQPPQGMQAKGTVLGPHTHTPAPTARGWRTSTARPVSGQSGEGERLTSDAPHNGERHPPRGRPSATPTASNAGLQGRTLWGRCWVPTPAPTAPGTHRSQNAGRPPQRAGGLGRDSA